MGDSVGESTPLNMMVGEKLLCDTSVLHLEIPLDFLWFDRFSSSNQIADISLSLADATISACPVLFNTEHLSTEMCKE